MEDAKSTCRSRMDTSSLDNFASVVAPLFGFTSASSWSNGRTDLGLWKSIKICASSPRKAGREEEPRLPPRAEDPLQAARPSHDQARLLAPSPARLGQPSAGERSEP